jgi:hypothetical protein
MMLKYNVTTTLPWAGRKLDLQSPPEAGIWPQFGNSHSWISGPEGVQQVPVRPRPQSLVDEPAVEEPLPLPNPAAIVVRPEESQTSLGIQADPR